jgi:hypothetical protein
MPNTRKQKTLWVINHTKAFKNYFLAQDDGIRAIRSGYISSLPSNIAKDKSSFEKPLKQL